MRKLLSIIFFLLTILGLFAEDCGQDFDIFDDSDLAVLEEIFDPKIDTKSHMSMMVPIVDLDKLKKNIKEIAQTYDSLKSKMAERFKAWKLAANNIESKSQQAEMKQSLSKLESDYQEMMMRLAKSESSDDEKMEEAKKLEVILTDAVEGGGIKVPDYLRSPEFAEFGDEIAKAGGIDALREQIANANMIKQEQALKNSFLVKHGDGNEVTRLMFAVDSVQNHELFMEKLGRFLGATGDYAVRFTVSGARTFVEITFGTLADSYKGYTLMVNLADEMIKDEVQRDLKLMANLEDGQFKELMTEYGIEIAINAWKELCYINIYSRLKSRTSL